MSSTTLTLRIKVTGFGPVPSNSSLINTATTTVQPPTSPSGGLFPSPVRRILTSMVQSRDSDPSPLLPDSEGKASSLVSSVSSSNRSSEAIDILVTNMTLQSTVVQLKKELFRILGPSSLGRYVRLIVAGRLLTPDSAPLNQFFQSMIPNSSSSSSIQQDDNEEESSSVGETSLFLKQPVVIVLHAVFAPPGVQGGRQAELSNTPVMGDTTSTSLFSRLTSRANIVRRGTGIRSDGVIHSPSQGEEEDSDEEEEEDSSTDVELGRRHSPRVRRGLDQLRTENHLSRDEINALRIYFASQIDQFIHESQESQEQQVGEGGDEDPAESARLFRLQMEEEWMETQGPFSEFRLNLNSSNPLLTSAATNMRWYRFGNNNNNRGGTEGEDEVVNTGGLSSHSTTMWMGTDRDFIWGFFLGFFVGFMMIFWVWLPTVSHKQKLGIMTGLCCHLVLKLAQDTSAVEDRTAVVDLMQEISDGY